MTLAYLLDVLLKLFTLYTVKLYPYYNVLVIRSPRTFSACYIYLQAKRESFMGQCAYAGSLHAPVIYASSFITVAFVHIISNVQSNEVEYITDLCMTYCGVCAYYQKKKCN